MPGIASFIGVYVKYNHKKSIPAFRIPSANFTMRFAPFSSVNLVALTKINGLSHFCGNVRLWITS
jgi:hypothetical protein